MVITGKERFGHLFYFVLNQSENSRTLYPPVTYLVIKR